MINLSDKQQLNWVRIIAVASTLVMMLYAPKLWITTKEFPVIPLFEALPIPQAPFDYIIAGLFFSLQLLYIFKNKRWLGWAIVLFYVYLAFVDQNRLQPYFYQSFLTILAISLFPKTAPPKKVLYAVMLIFIATYFWSGVHKLNAIFYEQWMHALNKHFSFIPQSLLQAFTYAVPWLEAIMGVLLLFNTTRKFIVAFIVSMHTIIIVLLIYLGYGFNVIPWNVQNILSVIVLFWGLKTYGPFEIFKANFNYQKGIVLFFTFLLPFSNIFGLWDHLLSYSFFTSKLKYYYIEVNEELEEKLPKHIHQYYRYNDNKPRIYMNEWAGDVNKVLFYPEDRIIQYMDVYLRSYAQNPKEEGLTKLVVYNQ